MDVLTDSRKETMYLRGNRTLVAISSDFSLWCSHPAGNPTRRKKRSFNILMYYYVKRGHLESDNITVMDPGLVLLHFCISWKTFSSVLMKASFGPKNIVDVWTKIFLWKQPISACIKPIRPVENVKSIAV